ncbi:ATP-dependent exoDNAse (exonuclease V), alpha subunit, helicase superfamily I [Actinacidiphila rubida]|uniref:ATP-dependent exoDNAse (Exonuclease V), alpha subunit, helicase superfamily I n=2 Tax=Actinacidiphila rubida TaxID=310780 RepID=A0A1H8RLI8_9ACTN|nr:helix-hairpin-helix domain-containing protein [Actinacidiphila rubida]SEO67321.1 ATP-dependent exoDNAse (exonuclease V), alpha subunit, helicase superfamily I [Actinacidiphila rubida]
MTDTIPPSGDGARRSSTATEGPAVPRTAHGSGGAGQSPSGAASGPGASGPEGASGGTAGSPGGSGSGGSGRPADGSGSEGEGGDKDRGKDQGAASGGGPGLAALAAAVKSIERGESPSAPAPRGDAAEARRKRREAMAAEIAETQAAEAAGEDGTPGGAAADAGQEPAAGTTGGPRRPRPAERPRAARQSAVVDPAAVEAVRTVLAAGGAPETLAVAAVRALGEGAAEALREDPWGVLALDGVRVEHADAFARALLGGTAGPGDPRRAHALVGHLMERAATAGHTALDADTLRAELARNALPDPAAAVAAAVEEGQVLVFRDTTGDASRGDAEEPVNSGDGGGAEDAEDAEADVPLLLALDRYALAEESVADGCVRLLRSLDAESAGEPDNEGDGDGNGNGDGDGSAARRAWGESAAAAAPSPSAAELIRAAAGSGLVLHTGGEAARAEPAALVAAARQAGLRAYAAAYTENGRRRLAEELGEDAAVTVEGLLDGTQGPGRAADAALALDLLAVLDAPRLSVVEAADLVEALPDGARLVLSGDPYTLPPAGPGRAFADLLAARICPRVASRTPDAGPIGELVSCVGEGELPQVDAPDKEVVVVPVRDPREAVHRAVQLVADSVPRAFGIPAEETQVVAVAHGGPVGTRALNAALKERLNPGPGRFGGFDQGDRVVYVPGPGRALPGTVAGAEPEGLRLSCEGGPVLVPREEVADAVRHGWAVTGHQAAAMRWPAVVVVVPGDAGALLNRAWVYTAFGRGERHLSVVQGADQALAAAVAEGAARPRTTRLVTVLKELAADE